MEGLWACFIPDLYILFCDRYQPAVQPPCFFDLEKPEICNAGLTGPVCYPALCAIKHRGFFLWWRSGKNDQRMDGQCTGICRYSRRIIPPCAWLYNLAIQPCI